MNTKKSYNSSRYFFLCLPMNLNKMGVSEKLFGLFYNYFQPLAMQLKKNSSLQHSCISNVFEHL